MSEAEGKSFYYTYETFFCDEFSYLINNFSEAGSHADVGYFIRG